eukprot:1329947-Lingulodinium_polyedra.AAC.1
MAVAARESSLLVAVAAALHGVPARRLVRACLRLTVRHCHNDFTAAVVSPSHPVPEPRPLPREAEGGVEAPWTAAAAPSPPP